ETYAAGTDERFGAGAGVTDHDRANHHDGGEDDIKEAVASGVKNQESEELGGVAIAVDDGVEKTAEAGHAIAGSSHGAIHQVEETGSDDDQPGVAEHASLTVGVSVAEQKSRDDVDHQTQEGEHVWVYAGQRKPAHDGIEQDAASSSKGAGPCFGPSPRPSFGRCLIGRGRGGTHLNPVMLSSRLRRHPAAASS